MADSRRTPCARFPPIKFLTVVLTPRVLLIRAAFTFLTFARTPPPALPGHVSSAPHDKMRTLFTTLPLGANAFSLNRVPQRVTPFSCSAAYFFLLPRLSDHEHQSFRLLVRASSVLRFKMRPQADFLFLRRPSPDGNPNHGRDQLPGFC